MILLIFSILIGLVVAYHIFKYENYWKYINKFPGPLSLPIIGNAHCFGTNPVDNHAKLFEMWKKYGKDKLRVYMGYISIVLYSDPKDVEQILSSTTVLKKGVLYELFHNWLGEGLLTSFGVKWFKHRKMITPSFHFKILQDFHKVMKRNSCKLVGKLADLSGQGNELIDIQNIIHYSTLDVLCETAMGTQINSMDNHDAELVKAFQDMCYVVQRRIFNPAKFLNIVHRFCEEYRIEKRALGILKTFTLEMIEKRRKLIKNTKSDKEDGDNFEKSKHVFLDTLLTSSIDGRPLTIDEIYEEVSTFLFEGHDTTTSGITFCIHLISRNQDVQARAYLEQVSIFGNKELQDIDPSYQDMQEMKYLEMIIKESLRLYPSVPMIARNTTEPIFVNGYYIPADTTIMIYIMAMGYNEKYFPDPYKFDPERFADRDSANNFAYVPFSAGPRNCIGQKFAMLEMKSVLSNLIRNFIILPPTDECFSKNGYEHLGSNKYDPVLASLLTLKSENGVHVRLQKRDKVH